MSRSNEGDRDQREGPTPIERTHAFTQPQSVARSGYIGAALHVLDWKAIITLAMALLLGLGTWELIGILSQPIALLLAGITIAEALKPIVEWLSRRMSRNLAIVIVYLALLILVVAIGWFVIPSLVDQLIQFLDRVPNLLDDLRNSIGGFGGVSTQNLIDNLSSQAASSATSLASVPFTLAQGILDVLLIVFMSVYWLIAAPSLKEFFLSLLSSDARKKTSGVLEEMGNAMGGYIRGVVIDAAIMGVLAAVGLFLIGVDYPIVLGVLTMLGELIPVIGPIVVAIPIIGIAAMQSYTTAILALVLYVALEQLEGHILTPNIMRSQTHASQITVIFALAAGAALGGILWALVAIPLAGAIRVLIIRVVAPWLRQWSGANERRQEPAPATDGR